MVHLSYGLVAHFHSTGISITLWPVMCYNNSKKKVMCKICTLDNKKNIEKGENPDEYEILLGIQN